MAQYVADTHALVWHLTASPSLSPSAKGIFTRADRGEDRILIPAIVIVEIIYLAEKLKVPSDLLSAVSSLTDDPARNYSIVPLDAAVARQVATIPRSAVPDPQDRIIAATARVLRLPLITKDAALTAAAGIMAVW